MYGLFRDTDRAMRPAMWAGIDYFYVDHGYYNYKLYDGYYRVCKNNLIHGVYTGMPVPNDTEIRNPNPVFNKLVVLAKPNLQGSFFLPFIKVMPEEWTDALKWRYEQAGWQVIVSGKTGQLRLLKDLIREENIGLVVGHDSAIEAFATQHGIHTANVSYETRQQSYRLVEPNAPVIQTRQLEKVNWYANRQIKLADLTWEHFV